MFRFIVEIPPSLDNGPTEEILLFYYLSPHTPVFPGRVFRLCTDRFPASTGSAAYRLVRSHRITVAEANDLISRLGHTSANIDAKKKRTQQPTNPYCTTTRAARLIEWQRVNLMRDG